MESRELNLAIAAASKLPRPQAARSLTPTIPAQPVSMTPRRNGEVLPQGVYRGYKGQLIAQVWAGDRLRYLGTFQTVRAALQAIVTAK